MTPTITTIINFCSNEARFISHSIREAIACSHQVLVPFSDHFFSGNPERWSIINTCIKENPEATFIQLPFEPKLRQKYGPHFWHNVARWAGIHYCKTKTDFVLFLDADEVLDRVAFQTWLSQTDLSKINAVKFLNYWYFRDTCYQATTHEDSVVMTRLSAIKGADIFSESERHSLKLKPFLDHVISQEGHPMIHHYSWVRTKEEMLRKVQNWGHTSDRKNWIDLVEEEFSRPFSGKDFVHNYTFNTVEPYIQLQKDPDINLAEKQASFSNKIVVTPSERDRILSERTLWRKWAHSVYTSW